MRGYFPSTREANALVRIFAAILLRQMPADVFRTPPTQAGNVSALLGGRGNEMNKVIWGDALQALKSLPDSCVQTCVTSPPYFAL
jgi:hypothetical protein